jgi:hypothetical protein
MAEGNVSLMSKGLSKFGPSELEVGVFEFVWDNGS